MSQPASKIGTETISIDVEPLGRIDVSSEVAFNFPTGVPGFPSSRRFVFVERKEFQPFVWMVALDQPGLAFVTIDPYQFFPRFRPRLSPEDLEAVNLSSQRRALLYAIVTVAANPTESTANLRAPVVLNTSQRVGRQAILASQEYSTREPLFGSSGSMQSSGGRDDNVVRSQGRRDPVASPDAQAQPEHHHR